MTDYNFKDGRIYEGSRNPGSGHQVGNVKDGKIYDGKGNPGSGHLIGKVSDFTINGIKRKKDETIVAVYHFLIKKIF